MLEIKNSLLEMVVESEKSLAVNDTALLELYGYFESMNKIVPLSNFEFKQNPPGQTIIYDYGLKAKDEREWNQQIFFEGEEPGMTFSISDKWKLPEFSLNRVIRLKVIEMEKKYSLTKIEISWY